MEDQDKIPKRPSSFPVFSKTLALQPITVVDYANQCKKHFQEFNEAFRRRINVELQYARNLDIVSKSLDRYIQPGTQKAISFICSAFKVQNQQRAHQARQLAQSLRTQIYEICMNSSKQQSILVKRVQKDVKKYIKQFESLEDNLSRCLQNYEKVSEDMQELIVTKNFLKYTSEIPQQKKNKIISKTIDSIKEKKEYEKLYLCANRNYNDFVREYNKCITDDMNQIENQIREQIVLESDCLRKLIVCEVSMFKNIEYDLINISKQMEALDTQKDVELLAEANQNNLDNLIIDQQEVKKIAMTAKQKRRSLASQISSTISVDEQPYRFLKIKESEVDKGMMAITLKHVEQEIFSIKLLNKKNKQFKELIEKRWLQLNPKTAIKQTKQSSGSSDSIDMKKEQMPENKPNEVKQEPPKQTILQQNVQTLRQKFDKCFIGSQFSKEILQSKKQQEKPEAINQVYENFLIITRYITELWNGLNITMLQSKKKSKGQQQSPLLYIKRILSVNHFYRIISYSFIESFRTHHQVMIEGHDRARDIAKFITALLTKSSKQNDVFILRGILGLLFTFYWVENNIKKLLYSEHSIYKHSLWKKHDFWDSSIFESTYQQMLSFGPQKGESFQETVLRQKNLIFSQLASYCHYMIMLGISSKNVRQIVGRFCRLYEMNDDQNRDLSKMITNTVKQYKQIVASYIKDPVKPEKEND